MINEGFNIFSVFLHLQPLRTLHFSTKQSCTDTALPPLQTRAEPVFTSSGWRSLTSSLLAVLSALMRASTFRAGSGEPVSTECSDGGKPPIPFPLLRSQPIHHKCSFPRTASSLWWTWGCEVSIAKPDLQVTSPFCFSYELSPRVTPAACFTWRSTLTFGLAPAWFTKIILSIGW